MTRKIRLTPLSATEGYAQHGDPHADGACMWCGKKLPVSRVHRLGEGWRDAYPLRGNYADGAFCTMRCGYAFGVTAAVSGVRMRAREKEA